LAGGVQVRYVDGESRCQQLPHRPRMKRGPRLPGRKKLIPASDREQMCPHSYIEEEELGLQIDCRECAGAQDIHNGRCLSGIVHVLARNAIPQTIVLMRDTHKRYRESALGDAFEAARALQRLNRAVVSTDRASDSRCRTCPASPSRVASALRRALLDDPGGYARCPAQCARSVVGHMDAVTGCDEGESCIGRTLADIGCAQEVR